MNDFINKSFRYAVVGVSQDKSKYGYRIFRNLRDAGYNVVPINPKYDEIDNIKCFKNMLELDFIPDVVITVVPPAVTIQVVENMLKIGVNKIWMQPGSESDDVVNTCKTNNIQYVQKSCIVVDGLKKKLD